MKIVSWNCNGAFRKKYKKILELDADIYVIQECEPLNEIKGELKKLISDGIWEKGANRKGVLVFAKPDVKLEKMEWDSFGMRVFIPIMINDSFPLIAVWTTKPAYIEEFYIWQLVNSGRINEDVVIIGDFNSNNSRVLDFDSNDISEVKEDNSLISVLPKEIIESAKSFSYKDSTLVREISNLTTQLDAIKNDDDGNDEQQKESATEKIRFLEKKIEEMKNERKSSDRILSTYDHRPLLLDALENAQNTVVILSPWIKSGGLNNEILGCIEKALQRNTRVIIGYGISKKEDSDRWILKRLADIQKKKHGNKLLLVKLSNTHEKVLIKDNEYMVITSFNWLSFKGDPNKGFRQETGYYTESKDAIKQMKENLSNRMQTKI